MANTNTLSNLYVEKASSEHPIALWMLNEKVDYVPHITEELRELELFANWRLENAEAVHLDPGSYNAPFSDSEVSRVIGDIPAVQNQDITVKSVFDFSENFLSEFSNFSVGFYTFFETSLANSISFGYSYVNTELEEIEVLYTELSKSNYRNRWIFFSNTFDLPPEDATDIKLIIRFNVEEGGIAGDYNFLVNGISIGQWSEDFNKTSYGVTPEDLPVDINLPSGLKAIPAFPYGASGNNAYYLAEDYKLLCKNFGVPLVFGSSNVTKILPNSVSGEAVPSLIFPGYGFLNDRGRHNSYTAEMWIRVNASASEPRKIFGSIASSDGLYVDAAYLTFKIGEAVGSHFIGEWYRPMLIHIRMSEGFASILINGEEVFSLSFDQESVVLPDEVVNGKSQDWLGFYAYEDVDPIDIDNFSIYPYLMPTEVTKRRWVWGQAVDSPEQTNSSLNSITAYNDFAFADYAANYNYPDFANWKQAFFSNVEAGSKTLSLPEYSLPQFSIGPRLITDLYSDTHDLEPNLNDLDDAAERRYLTLTPNSEWDRDEDFIYFQSLGILSDPVETIYGVFKTDGTETDKTLLKITNSTNGDYLNVGLDEESLVYSAKISGTTTVIATKSINSNEKFTAGFNISTLSDSQSLDIKRFFSNNSVLDMYIAGDGQSKFDGRIYKIGLDASYNNRKISSMYGTDGIMYPQATAQIEDISSSNGQVTFTTTSEHQYYPGDIVSISGVVSTEEDIFNLSEQVVESSTSTSFTIVSDVTGEYISGGNVTDYSNKMFEHTANYTLTAIHKYGIFFADIAVAGYWEDYMPLSYFSKSIADYDGSSNYELDSIQFNQDFPEPPAKESEEEISPWVYRDLQIEYSSPKILSYADLNNDFYTGWEDYEDMSNNVLRTKFFKTKDSVLRSFISFQKITDGANKNLIDFSNHYKPLVSSILDPSTVDLDWQDTAFEVTTGTMVYPPTNTFAGKKVSFDDYAIVYHLEFKSDGILHHPIKLRELQLASQVFERTDFTPVGSRFGIPVYYYSRSGLYFDLKAKNPITTYKHSTPYLYLNRQSGWRLRGDFDPNVDRGLAIPINLSQAEVTEVSSTQMWLRFSEEQFPADPVMVFSIDHNNGTYDFFIQADSSGQRGYIFAVDRASLEVLDDLSYYINGQSVRTPFLVNEEWVALGIEFPDLLDFSNRSGRINLNGPLTYNNISYNLATNIEKDETIETRIWQDMLSVHVAGITDVTSTGTEVTYTVTGNTFVVGETVSVSEVDPPAYNVDNAIVTAADEDTFTIESTATGTYVAGGVAESGKWEDIQTDLVVEGGETPPYAWQQVKIISQSRTFLIDPEVVYQKYTGTNRIVIDDESSGILVNPDRFKMYKDIKWVNTVQVPA